IRYRKPLRDSLLMLALLACSRDTPAPPRASGEAVHAYRDLAAALIATIPPDARVIGIGELHARTARAPARSTLAAFTAALPAIADQLSDLVIETWLADPRCGQSAVQATAQIESTVRRPVATKSEITELADAARSARIQPHAMTLSCTDYAAVAPSGGEV